MLFIDLSLFIISVVLLADLSGNVPVSATAGGGASLDGDREALLQLRLFLTENNPVNHGPYTQWNKSDTSPCRWPGITCNIVAGVPRVTGVNLRSSDISGNLFASFSLLTELTDLDLSLNSIRGGVPPELNLCSRMKYLNLSHNLIDGELNLTGLTNLEVLDVTLNRFSGEFVRYNIPVICRNLVTLNLSMNSFSGDVNFDGCSKLLFVDLSSNNFTGELWRESWRFQEFSVSENNLTAEISGDYFPEGCKLKILDLSANEFSGELPATIGNCSGLTSLNLGSCRFTGMVPPTIGMLSELQGLFLGSNKFNREIPKDLLNCRNLIFLDLSKNEFAGEIQPIIGMFTAVKYLLLHGNSYVGGIESSGIVKLPNAKRIDLSYNSFSGKLPTAIAGMPELEFLMLAYNNFSGEIPREFGNISTLQALDLSFNKLTGKIPSTIENLRSLLWLMLADNEISGSIPPEIGNCSSLLWLNLANNKLTGEIPPEISKIGSAPEATFEKNRRRVGIPAGSGECSAMKRWIPANYPPFSFTYTLMNRKSCRSTWEGLLKGSGIFPDCGNSTSRYRTLTIYGYLQLTGNQLSGEIPPDLGSMKRLSLLHLNRNNFTGGLPVSLGNLSLSVLNASRNSLSGKIPHELGQLRCLQSLDLSFNNFSGELPTSLNGLSGLSKLNLSYNPLISGAIPSAGQLSTFDSDSFIGDPLISFAAVSVPTNNSTSSVHSMPSARRITIRILLALLITLLSWSIVSVIIYRKIRAKVDAEPRLHRPDIRAFTYAELTTATENFSNDNVVGRGGYGVVYRGVLANGRRVAVKKLELFGAEHEFTAEFNVAPLTRHPHIVPLLGYCKEELILVNDYMDGGSLEELVGDWQRFGWRQRLAAAIGVTKALCYLHHECSPAVVHRDVKASNVLLDCTGEARIGDFGLARKESGMSTAAAGTVGYVAPEYWVMGRATSAADVYSFGVLAVELATGRRAVEESREESLVGWARTKVAAMDGGGGGAAEMRGLLEVGLRCAAEKPLHRPDMREVLEMLLEISGDVGDLFV